MRWSRGMGYKWAGGNFGEGDAYVHHTHCSDSSMNVCIAQYMQFIFCEYHLNIGVKKGGEIEIEGQEEEKDWGRKEEGKICEETILSKVRVDLGWMVVSRWRNLPPSLSIEVQRCTVHHWWERGWDLKRRELSFLMVPSLSLLGLFQHFVASEEAFQLYRCLWCAHIMAENPEWRGSSPVFSSSFCLGALTH